MFCRLIRWLIDRHLDGRLVLPGFVPRHVDRCPACRRYQAASRELIDELTAPADESPAASPQLRSRILVRVASLAADSAFARDWRSRGSRDEGPRLSPRARFGLYAGLAVAASIIVLAVLALVVLRNDSRPPNTPQEIVAPAPVMPAIEPAAAIDQSSQAIEDLAGQMYSRQMDALYGNALAASQGLLACIPVDVTPLLASERANAADGADHD